ncbi:MAG: phage antirepressor KilAC domain-containing protein [Corynebacterium matruchotii]|jgi:hypothetical protein|uniref:KilAC domain protein n=1 Tax=Siphoviridae sp. ctjOC2 TaxID=2825632 RepID=A0A8S5QAA3_9CAUD|nr:MAG TPA: KilAC domain protein [Siphoviridae sp. ctjOC2]
MLNNQEAHDDYTTGSMIVQQSPEGELTTTSLIIAEGTQVQHASVLRIIRDNEEDFEEFGRVRFEIRPFETAGGMQNRTIAVLNREHAMLLMTYMRNNIIVRQFKKQLIKAFTAMERKLADVRPSFDPSQITRLEMAQMLLNAETERLALEAMNKQLQPKADAYDSFIDAAGSYSMGVVAKMLGLGQNQLFRELRNLGVLIPRGVMKNTPYQKHMRYFDVKAHRYERADGEEKVSYTTYVLPKGINFIRRTLGLTRIDPMLPILIK